MKSASRPASRDVRRERRRDPRTARARAARPAGSSRGCCAASASISSASASRSDVGRFARPRRAGTASSPTRASSADARQALDDQPQAAVGQLEHLVDVRQRADRRADRPAPGSSCVGSRLREDADQLAAGDRVVDQLDGALARHGQRHERIRKQHRVAQRQHRHSAGTVYERSPSPGWTRVGLVAHEPSPSLVLGRRRGRAAVAARAERL